MKTEERRLSTIKPYPRNPRCNDAAVDAVVASIKAFGPRQPIVVDARGVIIIGHTRRKAALQLGLKTFPVHVARDLTPAQTKALRLADNKSHDLAEWDIDLLEMELAEVQALDVDMTDFGFSIKEIEKAEREAKGSHNAPELYAIVITCSGEDEQRKVYERLTKGGLKCRMLMS